jgi:protease stability complex PrcB-like protein
MGVLFCGVTSRVFKLAAGLAGFSLAAGAFQAARPVQFSVVPFRSASEVAMPCKAIITANQQWDRFVTSMQGQLDRPVKIDFARETVVALFAGLKSTGGYSIRVDKVEDESQPGKSSRAKIRYRVIEPPPGAMLTQSLNQPSVVIRLPKKFESIDVDPAINTSCPDSAAAR